MSKGRASSSTPPAAASAAVWDRVVRLFHWLLVAAIVVAWASTEGWLRSAWHEPAGYVAASLLLIRIVWGYVGGHHARFTQFVRAPAIVWAYTRRVVSATEPRYIGHNPLGGWMVIALLTCGTATAFSGWLFTTDRFWGSEALSEIHATLAWSMLGLIALHVAGVLYTSLRHRENLVLAMLSGRKAGPGRDDIA